MNARCVNRTGHRGLGVMDVELNISVFLVLGLLCGKKIVAEWCLVDKVHYFYEVQ